MISTPYKILVVDDEPAICEIIQDILESEYKELVDIQCCHSTEKALAIIEKEDVRIILCDFHLPGGDGDTLLKKSLGMSSGIRFIMLTGDVSFQTVMSSFLDGAVSIISKPFTPEDLITPVNICIKRLQYWQKKFSEV